MSLQEGVSLEIVHAACVGGYRIEMQFNDGHASIVDFGPFLSSSLNAETRQFLDGDKFKGFRLEWGNLVWGDYEMCFPIEDLYIGQLVRSPILAVAEDRATYGESDV